MKPVVLQFKNLLDSSQSCIYFWQMTIVRIKTQWSLIKNIVNKVNRNEYNGLLVDKKCMRQSMNRT